MRLFVALNLPPEVRAAAWRATQSLRERSWPVQWVREDALHLTLKFLGEVADEREGEMTEALARAAGGAGTSPRRPLPLVLAGCGAFPNPKRPRVVWVGVSEEPAMELLQHRVEREFEPLGFPVEGRPFRPHLTLGRVARDARSGDLRGLPEALEAIAVRETALIETLDLMQSTLQRGGAVYQVRRSEPLA